MSNVEVTINDQELKELERHLKKVRGNLSELKKPMEKVSIMLDRWVQKNFKSEGGNVGGWKPFAKGGRIVGKGKKAKLDTSAKLLQHTGRLKTSFIPFFERNEAGIGSKLNYAPTHEFGKGVPRRRMLPNKKDVLEQAERLLEKSIKDIIRDKR